MHTLHAQNVVLGAGAMGSAAAYHLARRGEPVVLDRAVRARPRSRQLARSGADHAALVRRVRITPGSCPTPSAPGGCWRPTPGQNLYLRTGGVSFCPPGVDYVARVAASLAAIGVPHRRMSGARAAPGYPVFQVPDETDVVFEPDAGMLAAARCVALEVALARALGGERTQVLDSCPVRRIDLEAERPTSSPTQERIEADRLIVTAGAWTRQLVPNSRSHSGRRASRSSISARPRRRRSSPAGSRSSSKGEGELDDFYGMPDVTGMGVKTARHGGPEADPDVEERTVGDEDRAIVRGFLRGCLPGLAEAPIDRTEICLYTVAPDEQFRLGFLPGRPDVIVASPCSGHGFKFSCRSARSWPI